ncbi:phosphatidylinositol transfer protein 3-like [Salvia splendens]|uniref:phosphatidylinositol transfer protein 3-like n=1 Tax=Salvia splendens TaxID=180675 RepID=UPI001C2670ED|nr:phosphatidylinositol transfer protein 3-like [Salvia splendens]
MGFGREDNHTAVQSVLQLLNKQSPLSLEQEKFCNTACVERFLKAKGQSVKKAAKHLRNCLSWRDSFATDHLVADEFSHELAEGMAYVAGHDHELKPVMIFRIRQDYQKFHSQKLFNRLLVFTLEVAIQTMAKDVEQFVILFDASLFRSASGFMNMLVGSLKIIGDYYPRRLHKAFVIDPPSLFSYFWKGVRAFVELSGITITVSTAKWEESLGFDASPPPSRRLGSSSSSRFSFTVSHHLDLQKPWYLSLSSEPKSSAGRRISHLNARSLSFASTPAISPGSLSFASTPMLSSLFLRRGRAERSSESFAPFVRFYRRPYCEIIYRSKIIRRSQHVSHSQRFSSQI